MLDGPAGQTTAAPYRRGANMGDYIYFLSDVNDEVDYRHATEDAWERDPDPDYIPVKFVCLICDGVDPVTAADLTDDGLPVGEPVDVADNGDLVVWPTMYEEAF